TAVESPGNLATAPTASSPAPVEEATPTLEPYRLTLTPSAPTASTNEEVTVTWKADGGPRPAKGIVPRVQMVVVWSGPGPAAAPTPSESPDCSVASTEERIDFKMQLRRSAIVRAVVVGCRDRAPVSETRATAETRVDWVAPYLAEVEIPAVLYAGTTVQG